MISVYMPDLGGVVTSGHSYIYIGYRPPTILYKICDIYIPNILHNIYSMVSAQQMNLLPEKLKLPEATSFFPKSIISPHNA